MLINVFHQSSIQPSYLFDSNILSHGLCGHICCVAFIALSANFFAHLAIKVKVKDNQKYIKHLSTSFSNGHWCNMAKNNSARPSIWLFMLCSG